jgi:putative ABC transport system permease protein
LLSDLRHAFRSLAKSPRFAVVALLALAIGIGANTAMFSVAYNVLLKPLAYPHPEKLVFIQETDNRRGGMFPTSPATYADWRDRQTVFQSIASTEAWDAALTGDGRPEQVDALHASTSLLDVLGVQPMFGRGFRSEDTYTVLLSYTLWQRRFAGDPRIVGKSLTLNDASYTVTGVMPPGFQFPPFWQEKAELWAPFIVPPARLHARASRSVRVFARLRDGVTIEQAQTQMSAIARQIEREYPATDTDIGARIMSLEEATVGKIKPALLVLLAAVGFLLLIACANVANLLLARATGRQKEIALRAAIGASRWRIVRQLLAESAALAMAGSALGLLLAYWAIHALTGAIPEASRFTLPRYREIGIGIPVLLFTVAISAVTAILFGLAPALQSSRPDLNAALKEAARGSSRQSGRLRNLLVVSEVAVSLILLSGAGLMIRSFRNLSAVDSGFDPRNVLSMTVNVAGSPFGAPDKHAAFFRETLTRVAAVPGVRAASGINHLPLAGDQWTFDIRVEGQPEPAPGDEPNAVYRLAFPRYFETMRIPLEQGRDFTDRDDANAPRVAIVNQTMSRRYWPNGGAIGKRFRNSSKDRWATVVGIVRDAEQRDWGSSAYSEFYLPFPQSESQSYFTLVARTAGDPRALVEPIEKAVWALDPDLPIAEVQSMEQVVNRAVWQPRFSTTLLGGFAALALALAAIGIYGVISYGVGQRQREIGIRMALGARPGDVQRDVLGEIAKLAAVGSAAGIAGALLLTRYLQTLLYQVSATDPVVIALAACALGAVALAAAWLPARRATRVDPAAALRGE